MWRCTGILEIWETLGPLVSLVPKEKGVSRGHRGPTSAMVDQDLAAHKDLLETPAGEESKGLPVPLDTTDTKERWGSQVSKGGTVVQVLVGNLDRTDHQDQEDLKVLKEKRVHLDQDLKDLQEKREIQGVQDHRGQMGNQGTTESLVLQEKVAPVAPKEGRDPRDVEVLLGTLGERVVMVLPGTAAP